MYKVNSLLARCDEARLAGQRQTGRNDAVSTRKF